MVFPVTCPFTQFFQSLMLFRWRGAITLAVREKGGNWRHCLHTVAVLVPDTCTLQTMHRPHFRGLYLVRGMAQLCLRWHGGRMGLPLTWNKLVFKFTFNKNARNIYPVVQILILEWDQGYMIQCIFDPWFLDPGWKKSGQIPYNFWVKNTKILFDSALQIQIRDLVPYWPLDLRSEIHNEKIVLCRVVDLDPDLHLIRYVFCSVVDLDPNPQGSAFIWLYWILIWNCIKKWRSGSESGSMEIDQN
jgi:hypothetical protein